MKRIYYLYVNLHIIKNSNVIYYWENSIQNNFFKNKIQKNQKWRRSKEPVNIKCTLYPHLNLGDAHDAPERLFYAKNA